MRRRPARKKWALIAVPAVLAAAVMVVLFVDIEDPGAASGTMGAGAAVTIGNLEAEWTGGPGDGVGRLADEFVLNATVTNRSGAARSESFELYFSRDDAFSPVEDCRVDARTVSISPTGPSAVQFRSTGRLVRCLDAGPWFAAIRLDDGSWYPIDEAVRIANGDAEFELISAPRDVAPRSTFELTAHAHRPATEAGFDGLYEYPVQVWIRQAETLCVAEARPVTISRSPEAGFGRNWKIDPVALTVSLRSAKEVEAAAAQNPFETPRADIAPVSESADSCSLQEGPFQLAVAPSSSSFRVVEDAYHHARPVVVETGKIEVSVRAGEVVTVSRTAYNPSVREVTWSSGSVQGSPWMIGMEDQRLASKKPSSVEFTVSAVDLEPGVYDDSVRVRVADFYGTEVRLPVEITVLPSRNIVREESAADELPSEFSLGNYPNPFNPATTIRFDLPQRERVSLVVFDVSGRQIRTLHDGELSGGTHEIRFDAGDLPSGTYLYRFSTPSVTKTEQMVLVK